MQGTLQPVFFSRQLVLASTAKPVTPFGGWVSLIELFNLLKLGEVLGRLMPFAYTSPYAIVPEQTLLAFIVSIICGALRQGGFGPWRGALPSGGACFDALRLEVAHRTRGIGFWRNVHFPT